MEPLVTNNPELKSHEPSLLSSTILLFLLFPLHKFFSRRFIITDQHPQYYNSLRLLVTIKKKYPRNSRWLVRRKEKDRFVQVKLKYHFRFSNWFIKRHLMIYYWSLKYLASNGSIKIGMPVTAMRNSNRKVTALLFLFLCSLHLPPFSSFCPSSSLSVMLRSRGQHLSPILPRLTSGGSTSVTGDPSRCLFGDTAEDTRASFFALVGAPRPSTALNTRPIIHYRSSIAFEFSVYNLADFGDIYIFAMTRVNHCNKFLCSMIN